MTTAAHPKGSGWEHLTAPSADFIDAAPEEPQVPRSRIRRRFQAMLVQILGDEADRQFSPEPLSPEPPSLEPLSPERLSPAPPWPELQSPEPAASRSSRGYESKHRRIS